MYCKIPKGVVFSEECGSTTIPEKDYICLTDGLPPIIGGILCINSMNWVGMNGTTGFNHCNGRSKESNPITAQETIAGSRPMTINLTLTDYFSKENPIKPHTWVTQEPRRSKMNWANSKVVVKPILRHLPDAQDNQGGVSDARNVFQQQEEKSTKLQIKPEKPTWNESVSSYFGGEMVVNLSKTES
jgi:hypothetical protein